MGNLLNCFTSTSDLSDNTRVLPIDTTFQLPSPLPSWPKGTGGFARGSINLGGLEVCQISSLVKIWAAQDGGPDNLGATFFEPANIPDGFSMLGCYSQSNNKPPFGWALAAKDDGSDPSRPVLEMPVDYTLIWSSESMKTKQQSHGYIWLPVPPNAYRAVGHVVTNTSKKPPLDKIRCVHSELTEPCEPDSSPIWSFVGNGSNTSNQVRVYSLRPVTRGTQALGVCVGTFVAQLDGSNAPLSLSCLKNKDSNYLSNCMPNMSQIETLVQTYSPYVYLHPDESYLPSSVSWFFDNGALLYKKPGDELNNSSTPIESSGSNVPQGGSNDGEYWLDLPVDEAAKERVKGGDLQDSQAYLHIKSMFGATFTDIAIWVFYPFNGPARAKVQLVDIPLGRIGEHVGDWEHVTLRFSNFTGELWRVYFSEHSGGAWEDASLLEFKDGNKVVAYASLNGHAFYAKPGLVLQGSSSLGIGIRNDTAKSDNIMDTGARPIVVSAEYLEGEIVEPPWLNYAREWGPKISYEIADELKKVEKLLPGEVKVDFGSLVNILPNEVLGEEGPTGPKMKKNWNGDEV